MTHSFTRSETFTIVHARNLSSKVAADMHLCARYYGEPSEQRIRDFAEELAQYLNAGYVAEYEFGYKKADQRVISWRYKVDEQGNLMTDDRPGNVAAYVDVTGATFFNFILRNVAFTMLSSAQQASFEASLPIQRTMGNAPRDGMGYWTTDRNYYSGGKGLARETFQPLG